MVSMGAFLAAENLFSSPVLIRETHNDGSVSEKRVESQELGGGLERITIKKESLGGVAYVDIIPDFAQIGRAHD